MSNITTDLQSFENIDYSKNIYELLLALKNQPIEINCNTSESNENPIISEPEDFKKYNSEEILLRIDPIFGEIYTKSFYQELICSFHPNNIANVPEYFTILEEIESLQINTIIDFSAKLTENKRIVIPLEDGNFQIPIKKTFHELNNSIYIDYHKIFLNIPTSYVMNETSYIVNEGDFYPYRKFQSFVTLVYAKY